MTLYLLDSDAVIDYLNGFMPSIAFIRRFDTPDSVLCTCDVVVAEVYAGLRQTDWGKGDVMLDSLRYLPRSAGAAKQAGRWRFDHARRGRQLSATDCLIAATAAQHGAVLITGNGSDFPMPEIVVALLPRRGRTGGL